jgi:hypothetical protein
MFTEMSFSFYFASAFKKRGLYMRKNFKLLLFILVNIFFILPINLNNVYGSEWELVKEADGIKVFKRNFVNSSIDEFKAVTIIDTSVEIINEVLLDVSAQKEWMAFNKEVSLIEKNEDGFVFYHVLDMPWPVANRDVVIKTIMFSDMLNGLYLSYFFAVNNFSKLATSDNIRIKQMKGKWYFKRISKNKTYFACQMHIEPGGKLPSFIINQFSENIAFLNIKAFKKISKRLKYARLAQERTNNLIQKKVLTSFKNF